MTPLALRIVRNLGLPKNKRSFFDDVGLLPLMSDLHCFELSPVFGIAKELAGEVCDAGMLHVSQQFLPAPRTWLEFKTEAGPRIGIHLEQSGDNVSMRIAYELHTEHQGFTVWSPDYVATLYLKDKENAFQPTASSSFRLDERDRSHISSCCYVVYGALALINTPRIIGRRQHMPHRGLERELIRNQKMVGKFPLHAWTEILLEVRPPVEMCSDPSVEAHLTGRRALHFCRAHLRIRLGALEIVSSSWRGDPALGIRQSRYAVVPARYVQ
jgi:hypothetical protein